MKILRVKIKGSISPEAKQDVVTKIRKDINAGIVVCDDAVQIDVLEFDEVEGVESNGKSN